MAWVVILSCAAASAAAAPPRSFDGANKAYAEGRWADAIAGYEALVAAGMTNRDLYFNLGNAYFRDGRLGPAIYNYERALRLAPEFGDARHNLELARDEVAKRWPERMKSAEKVSTWIQLITTVSTGTLSALFLVFNLLFFGALIIALLLRRGAGRTTAIIAGIAAGVVTVALGIVLWSNIQYTQKLDHGIVLDDQLHMREGAYEQSGEGALIHAGLRVRIVGRESGWLHIRLANGHAGWVPAKAIGEL